MQPRAGPLPWRGSPQFAPLASLFSAVFPSLCLWTGLWAEMCPPQSCLEVPQAPKHCAGDLREDFRSQPQLRECVVFSRAGHGSSLTPLRPDLLLGKLLETHLSSQPSPCHGTLGV